MFDFGGILEMYNVKKYDSEFYDIKEKSEDERRSIELDVERSYHGKDMKSQLLKKVLQKVLEEIPQEYIQGMNDIAAVIVDFYYKKKIAEMVNEEGLDHSTVGSTDKNKSNKDDDDVSWEKDADLEIPDEQSVNSKETDKSNKSKKNDDLEIPDEQSVNSKETDESNKSKNVKSEDNKKEKKEKNITQKEIDESNKSKNVKNEDNKKEKKEKNITQKEIDEGFNRILKDKKLYDKIRITLANIIEMKYMPLVRDDFQLYLRTNRVFIRMMRKRGVLLQPDESIVYMNFTLRWFTTCVETKEDLYQLFSIILTCPTSFTFLILIYYFDTLKANKKIKVKENIMVPFINLEKEFLETEFQLNQPKLVKKSTIVLVMGGLLVGGVAAAIMLARK